MISKWSRKNGSAFDPCHLHCPLPAPGRLRHLKRADRLACEHKCHRERVSIATAQATTAQAYASTSNHLSCQRCHQFNFYQAVLELRLSREERTRSPLREMLGAARSSGRSETRKVLMREKKERAAAKKKPKQAGVVQNADLEEESCALAESLHRQGTQRRHEHRLHTALGSVR
ncbi:hypothetical protein BOTBODRAFT_196349 [Botryobasidium botryosum FD-172 SS1]|uniref:Uncharacterized protein n=1 Tax=Botryobasidium botryosum (strain FD-172 SS1) TaxID=930990 RepID=A0A067N043_BOTB1|nr:hypothetical protein BOTBODRAFT_196349 [Botryobasidium botryosum FD-172 SS1]